MTRIPTAPLILGLAGLIPFLWGAVSAQVAPLQDWGGSTFGPRLTGPFVLIHYGTIILCFMSGVLWGFATKTSGQRAAFAYALSVIPALWIFLFSGNTIQTAAISLIFGFVGLLVLDYAFARWDLAPPWWMRLRILLTSVVSVCLVIGVLL